MGVRNLGNLKFKTATFRLKYMYAASYRSQHSWTPAHITLINDKTLYHRFPLRQGRHRSRGSCIALKTPPAIRSNPDCGAHCFGVIPGVSYVLNGLYSLPSSLFDSIKESQTLKQNAWPSHICRKTVDECSKQDRRHSISTGCGSIQLETALPCSRQNNHSPTQTNVLSDCSIPTSRPSDQ